MAAPRDIVVVGAGVVGCAVAFELARRGASVEIIDDRPAGMGATQAAAGVLAPYIEARTGGPLLELTSRSLDLFDTFVGCVVSESGCPVNYQRTGTLDVAFSPDSMLELTARHAFLSTRGVDASLLDAAAVRREEPNISSAAVGGLLIPAHGFVSATDLTRALVAAARRHGARMIEHGRVRRVSLARDEFQIDTDRGSLSGDAVVIAAGSWAGEIAVEGTTFRVPVRPVRGQLLQLGWVGPMLTRVTWSDRCYIVPWPDRTVLVGATVEDAGFDERTTVAGVRDLIEAACEVVPQAWTASVTAARVGLRPATPDELPVIGSSAILPNMMYATGHYRNGVLLAPLTAAMVADEMLNGIRDPLLALTSPQRFGPL